MVAAERVIYADITRVGSHPQRAALASPVLNFNSAAHEDQPRFADRRPHDYILKRRNSSALARANAESRHQRARVAVSVCTGTRIYSKRVWTSKWTIRLLTFFNGIQSRL